MTRNQAMRWGVLLACVLMTNSVIAASRAFPRVVQSVQPNMVKIYGAGGIRGLEAYQSGMLISKEGHVLTVWSYVLDTDYITVTLNDGRKFKGELVGADPRLEIAVLKIEAEDLACFNVDESVELGSGDRVLAFSNLFGVATGNEPASVLHGSVAVRTPLSARRGAFESTYTGDVYVLDAMTNNPGAAGGALTDRQGRLVGLLGKELRNSLNNTWLNYAIPMEALAPSIDDILSGRVPRPRDKDAEDRKPMEAWSLELLGITLVPDVLPKTPPFVDRVRADSPAAKADLQVDDLILFVNDHIASSCKNLVEELSYIDRIDPVILTVQRGTRLLDVELTLD